MTEDAAHSCGADAVWHHETRQAGERWTEAVGRDVVSKRRTIEVVVVVVGLVFLFGFLAVVILSLFLGIG